MTDAVDEMVAKQASRIKADIELRQTALADLREAIEAHEAELSVLRGKLADIAGTAPIPPDTKIFSDEGPFLLGPAIQDLRNRPARKVIT